MSVSPFPIQRVENIGQWFKIGDRRTADDGTVKRSVHVRSITLYVDSRSATPVVVSPSSETSTDDDLAILRFFYDSKVGHFGCYWCDNRFKSVFDESFTKEIEFQYANIKFGDLFEFYTSADGILRLPKWGHFKYALDEFLMETD